MKFSRIVFFSILFFQALAGMAQVKSFTSDSIVFLKEVEEHLGSTKKSETKDFIKEF